MKLSKRSKALLLIFSLGLCFLVGWGASFFTDSSVGNWYLTLKKPSWNPPNLAFPIAWSILYAMMGFSLWIILCKRAARRRKVLIPYFVQLGLNFTWSYFFFYLQSPLLGLINIILLLVAIGWNIKAFWTYSKKAALLLVPYFLWVGYATGLNFSIWYLN